MRNLLDSPVTKRQLGGLICLLAVVSLAGILAADLVGAGQFGGMGPAQLRAVGAAAAALVFGLSLLPLGNRPA